MGWGWGVGGGFGVLFLAVGGALGHILSRMVMTICDKWFIIGSIRISLWWYFRGNQNTFCHYGYRGSIPLQRLFWGIGVLSHHQTTILKWPHDWFKNTWTQNFTIYTAFPVNNLSKIKFSGVKNNLNFFAWKRESNCPYRVTCAPLNTYPKPCQYFPWMIIERRSFQNL